MRERVEGVHVFGGAKKPTTVRSKIEKLEMNLIPEKRE